jgi:AcrR family transcriptional regulator
MKDTYSMYVKKATQSEATRKRLEDVARKLFAEQGFFHVSGEELVAAARVTRGALYHHYDGKEGLFAAVVENVMREVQETIVAQAAGARDPLRALQQGIAGFLGLSTQPEFQRILLIDAPAVLGWQRWREMDGRHGFGLMRNALAAAVHAHLLRAHDPDMLAHLLQGALIEAAMVIARADDPTQARKIAEQAIGAMIEGWRVA